MACCTPAWPWRRAESWLLGSWIASVSVIGSTTTQRSCPAIARALVGGPDIVLADEPTGNLDSKTSDAIVELIEDLSAAGSTIVVITHNHEIATHFPRSIGLRDGLVEYDRRNGSH